MNQYSPLRRMPAAVQHVTTSLDLGGAQAMLLKLVGADPCVRPALQHSIVSLLRPGVLAPAGEDSRCSVYTLNMRRTLPTPPALLRLLRITGCERPDLIQGWMYHGNVAASVAGMAQARSVPVIWNVRHSLADPKVESRATRALLALSARLSRSAAAIIYNSHVSARQHEAIGFDERRSAYVPNGFDSLRYRVDRGRSAHLRDLFGIPGEGIIVGMVARLHPMKDHAMLVEAVARGRAMGHDLHLLMVGTGLDTPPPPLARLIAQLLPPDRVTLVGERHDVAEWLPGIDILALSSAWGEAFPNVLGEAMMCGLPCVATDVGDSALVLGESGTIVPPRDAEAMAAALARIAAEGAEGRVRRGDVARARAVEHYELAEVARRYHSLYLAILEGAWSQPERRAYHNINPAVRAT